ncbi:MAG: nucleotidyltransferase domain-containing protein [Nitrospira sp.]|nr:nucleotidyltransferase domain-containing protein [Nitrospira sp.]
MGIKQRWKRYRPLPEDILQRIDGLTPLLKEKGIRLVYLFGSLLKGKGEDVDIALLYDGDISQIREELQRSLGVWRLDIVNLKNAPVWISFEIIRTGRLIYKIDTETENSFETHIIKRYQDLKPIRDKQLRYLKENLGVGL